MILIINLWMILMLDKHPKVDDSYHQFMDVSSMEQDLSKSG